MGASGEASRASRLGAVLAFHLRSAVRLALRASAPLAGAFVILAGLSPDPGAFIAGLAVALSTGGGGFTLPLLAAALALAVAGWASARVTRGLADWMRHLPVSGDAQRRAAALALVVAQAPILLGMVVLMAGAAACGVPVDPARVAGVPLVGFGAALAVLPVRRRVATVLAGAGAAVAGVMGSFALLAAGVLALAVADRFAGPPTGARPRVGMHGLPFLGTASRIALRALGFRPVGSAVAAIFPLLAGWLFSRNNHLAPWTTPAAGRLAGVAAVAILLAGTADVLATRRPVWPWARTLPWSARARAAWDAAILAGFALPIPFLSMLVSPRAALPVLGAIPFLALRSAAAMRLAPQAKTGTQGRVVLEGLLAAGWIALVPWLAAAAVLASPLALRLAAKSEREVKVGRFMALHHLAAGDPLSWSGR